MINIPVKMKSVTSITTLLEKYVTLVSSFACLHRTRTQRFVDRMLIRLVCFYLTNSIRYRQNGVKARISVRGPSIDITYTSLSTSLYVTLIRATHKPISPKWVVYTSSRLCLVTFITSATPTNGNTAT